MAGPPGGEVTWRARKWLESPIQAKAEQQPRKCQVSSAQVGQESSQNQRVVVFFPIESSIAGNVYNL